MAEPRRAPRGLIDTSVVIDLDELDPDFLPDELAVSALTMAELAAGPHAAGDSAERARRQDRLQRAEATFTRCRLTPLPHVPTATSMPRSWRLVVRAGARGRWTC